MLSHTCVTSGQSEDSPENFPDTSVPIPDFEAHEQRLYPDELVELIMLKVD